jgi:RHS repeat-associated protein
MKRFLKWLSCRDPGPRAGARHLPALALCLSLLLSLFSAAQADTLNQSRTQTYTYDGLGRVSSETQDAGNANLCRVSTYSYDGYGNRSVASVSPCAGASTSAAASAGTRSVTDTYGYGGLFPTASANAVGHTTQRTFDLRFGQVSTQTDANNLVSNFEYDSFGRKVRQTDPDGTYTVWEYVYCSSICPAAWTNRRAPEAVSQPAWYVKETEYGANNVQIAPYKAVFYNYNGKEIRQERQGDVALGQTRVQVQDTFYDQLGRVIHQTGWYEDGSTNAENSNWVSYVYDARDRVTLLQRRDPDISGGIAQTTYSYDRLAVTVSNGLQTKYYLKSPQGLDTLVRHSKGSNQGYVDVSYAYDANNNLVRTTAAGVITSLAYDAAGNKTGMSDPSMGVWQYKYNVFGELVEQTDSLSKTSKLSYDKLGRMTKREEADMISSWAYDNAVANCKIGLLCKASSGPVSSTATDYERTHAYDTLSRPTQVSTKLGTETLSVKMGYEPSTGRLSSKTYPATGLTGTDGIKELYGYTALGNLNQVQMQMGTAAAQTMWSAQSLDDSGRVLRYTLGNTVKGKNNYSNVGVSSGRLYSQLIGTDAFACTGPELGCAPVVNRSYTWNQLGNLMGRSDRSAVPGVTQIDEAFAYDSRDRLTQYSMTGGANGALITTQVRYDDKGNITYKSDTGTYAYDPDRPYRLTSVSLGAAPAGATSLSGTKAHTLQFDDGLTGAKAIGVIAMGNGNLRCSVITDADGTKVARWQEYSSFNMPTRIEQKVVDANFVCPASGALPTGATTSLSFVYGPEHQRIKQVVSGGPQAGTTLYLNGPDSLDLTYERTIKSNGVTEHKHFLNLPDGAGKSGTLAQVTLRTGTLTSNPVGQQQAQETSYLHQDHIGSVMAVTNETGTVVERMAYDPWGNRRNTNGVPDPNDQLGNAAGSLYRIDRGFTLHEMLDEVGLIHMNGRVYEPALGKFMSADPMVTYPSRATSFNRYAYGMDNPLRFVDPTGFQVEEQDANGSLTGVVAPTTSQDNQNTGTGTGFQATVSQAFNHISKLGVELGKTGANFSVEDAFPKDAPILQMGKTYGILAAHVQALWTRDQVLRDLTMEGLQQQKEANFALLGIMSPSRFKLGGQVESALRPGFGRRGTLNEIKQDLRIPRSQHPDSINREPMTDKKGKNVLSVDGKPVITREYTFTRKEDGSKFIVQDHSAGHKFGSGGNGDQGRHFNVRPPENRRNGSVLGTKDHYDW